MKTELRTTTWHGEATDTGGVREEKMTEKTWKEDSEKHPSNGVKNQNRIRTGVEWPRCDNANQHQPIVRGKNPAINRTTTASLTGDTGSGARTPPW